MTDKFIANKDYFTLNDRAFFRIHSCNETATLATLYCKDENEEFEEIETGIYPLETLEEALNWDEEDTLILEYGVKNVKKR